MEAAGGEQVQTLGRLLQVVDRREVVGVGEAAVRAGIGQLVTVLQVGVRVDGFVATDVEATPDVGTRTERTGGDARSVDVLEVLGTFIVRFGRDVAIAGHDFFLLGVADRHHARSAFAGGTDGQVSSALLAVAFGGLAVGHAELGAFEVFAGDDVDHTGDGVRTVDGGGAVFQHVNALDDGDRNGRQVDSAVEVGDPTLAVHQNQGTVSAQATEGDLLRTIGTVGLGGGGGQTRTVRRRDAVQDVEHVGQTGFFDVGAGNHGDRLGGFSIDALNTRTGNFHAIQSFGFFFFLGKGGNRCCGRGGANKQCKFNCI